MSRRAQVNGKNHFFTTLPFVPEDPQFLCDFQDLLKSQMFTNRGPWVQRFESEILSYLGNEKLQISTCSNATLGLEIALKTWGLKGQVIVTPFTFVATVHAIKNAGLEPVFADIDMDTLCLSPQSVEQKINSKVCAVLPVHAFGAVCDTDYFDSLRSQGIKVLYDSAHAFGVRKNGSAIGQFGDAEVFSFHSTKLMHSFEGGAITSYDEDFIKRIKLMTNFGICTETQVDLIGTNAKMSEVHALMGSYSLRNLSSLIEIRKEIVSHYDQGLKSLPQVFRLPAQLGVESNAHYYPIFFEDQATRDELYDHLRKYDIMARKYFYPAIHQLEVYKNLHTEAMPNAEKASACVLCLPLHIYLTLQEQDIILGHIEEFFTARARRSLRAA